MFHQSYNINCHFLVALLFQICIYWKYCSCKCLLQVFQKFNVIVYRQSDYRDTIFGAIYLKYCSCSWRCWLRCSRWIDSTVAVLDISDTTQYIANFKSRSISQLIKCKTSVSKIFIPADVLPIILFCTQKIYMLLSYCYLSYNQQHFQSYHHSLYVYDNSTNFEML